MTLMEQINRYFWPELYSPKSLLWRAGELTIKSIVEWSYQTTHGMLSVQGAIIMVLIALLLHAYTRGRHRTQKQVSFGATCTASSTINVVQCSDHRRAVEEGEDGIEEDVQMEPNNPERTKVEEQASRYRPTTIVSKYDEKDDLQKWLERLEMHHNYNRVDDQTRVYETIMLLGRVADKINNINQFIEQPDGYRSLKERLLSKKKNGDQQVLSTLMRRIQTKNENAAEYASALKEITRGELPEKMLAERFCDGLEAEELRVKARLIEGRAKESGVIEFDKIVCETSSEERALKLARGASGLRMEYTSSSDASFNESKKPPFTGNNRNNNNVAGYNRNNYSQSSNNGNTSNNASTGANKAPSEQAQPSQNQTSNSDVSDD